MTHTRRPNVLLIMTDQQRWDTLRCYGRENAETPNLDWLSDESTIFDNAYTCTPSCTPARASLLTGKDPWNTGILGMGGDQPELANMNDEVTLPGELAAAGYHTQGIGKMHFSPARALFGFHNTVLDELRRSEDGFRSDYLKWFDREGPADVDAFDHGLDVNSWMGGPWHVDSHMHPTAWTVTESIRFLEQRDPTRPFFLKTSFQSPHSPMHPPQYFLDLHLEAGVPEPAIGEWAADHEKPAGGADPNAWRGRRTPRETIRSRAAYQASISFVDNQLGRLFNYLRHHHLLEDLMIIFTADHGDMIGDHDLWRKTYAYEGSAHIPMLVRMPGASSAVPRSDALVTLQDIMPTILEACGLEIPETVDGHSMVPMTQEPDAGARQVLHGEHSTCYDESQEMQFLVDGRWKYIWFARTGTEQLFDLSVDRYECHDLSADADHRDELLRWRAKLVELLEQRDAGLTDGAELVNQAGRPYLRSPVAARREEAALP